MWFQYRIMHPKGADGMANSVDPSRAVCPGCTLLAKTCRPLWSIWIYRSRDMTKQTKWVCPQWRLRSARASAQSDQSSLSAWRKLQSLATHRLHSKDSDQTRRMPRLSLRWMHTHFVGFVMSQLIYRKLTVEAQFIYLCCLCKIPDQSLHCLHKATLGP